MPKTASQGKRRGKVDPNDPPEETEARTKIQQALGFSLPQADNSVYGIVQNKKLEPISLEQVMALTQTHPDQIKQKLNVKKIDWPGV